MNPSHVANSDTRGSLVLVGAGVHFPDQLTAEALDALASSRMVLTIVPDVVLRALPATLREKCTPLWHLYEPNRKRAENYRTVIEAVMSALKEGGKISWLTPGHPLVFDSVSEGLRARAHAEGVSVEIVPGISCIDTVLADVGYEPANGLVVHEATAVVEQGIALDPRLATILLQLGVFGTALPRLTGKEPLPDFAPLRDHVLRFYPDETRVAFVRSRWSQPAGTVVWVTLNEMLNVTREYVDGTSMFISRADHRGLLG